MVCLRCGYCCIYHWVIIVDDPKLGPVEENLKEKGNGRCQHLIGNKPGELFCAIHDEPWYKETPCFSYGQIEENVDAPCRMGKYLLRKKYI